ncbi:MAG: CRISPR-associated endonuclease Cas3'' [Rhodopseudomonas palustris]|nr:CRISPR-associated endonuclease Cas3'' [Rhodopseudomonas palustris]
MYLAHSTSSADGADWEPLLQHLQEVAALARQFGDKFGGGNAAELAGLLHDLGKYAAAFQAYIRRQRSHGGDHASAVTTSRFEPEQSQDFVPQIGKMRVAAVTGILPVDCDVGLHLGGPIAGKHNDTLRQEQRLFDVVRHQERGEALTLPERYDLGFGMLRRVSESSLPSGSSRIRISGSLTSRARQRHPLCHAAGQLMRIRIGEALQPHQFERGIDAMTLAS